MESSELLMSLIVGTLFLYGIGIALPTLFRFVLYKKEVSSVYAIVFSAIWWIILWTVMYIMHGQNAPNPIPLLIITFITFKILTRVEKDPSKKKKAEV